MIRQSFQNIVNPENIIENFGSEGADADADTTKYYELISNMESQCDVIIDEMDISNFGVSDDNKCVTDGRTYAKSDKDYVTLRRENLNRIEVEYNKINGETTLTDFEKNSQLLCIMNKLFYNGFLSDVKITDEKFLKFINNNSEQFSILANNYLKLILLDD